MEKLSSFFYAVLEKHKGTNFVGGCIFGNIALEMSDNNHRFSSIVEKERIIKLVSNFYNVIEEDLYIFKKTPG